MKKIASALFSAILLLGLTACGSDEPKDDIWYMNSQLINHVTDINDGTLESATMGAIATEFNITKMTADVNYALAIDGKEIIVSVTNAKLTAASSSNGYFINVPATATADNHRVTNMHVYIDMNIDRMCSCHWVEATIDDAYTVKALVPAIAFYDSKSNITRPNGQTKTDNDGDFIFSVSDISTEHRSAALTISGINGVEPLQSGIQYTGLKVEATDTGLHIYSDDKVFAKGKSEYPLNSIDANIDFITLSFNATLDIQDTGKIDVTGTF